ncbi:hypothetical protein [Sphaerospermopsis torques-reginae]|jgi:hypothetical protein|uniref:Uncharacterized protein n=1 Tax=Sphaerospermopsis torques-reginae ITEP-024 TaxID=984208 RepID=A0ABX8WXZ9_9CYAN|nr:hypothetical protein [Sphaerospermopsis torques-reginae]QYX31250.1 hypothetical protein K2F26_20880 [Sphaerospermopsis torques-reginae ITEP-024]
MNKYNVIAYIINALILFLLSFASTIFSRKYNFRSLMTEAFKPKTDLEVDEKIQQESPSDSKLKQENITQEKELDISKIEQESPLELVLMKENSLDQENSIIDGESKITSINELIKDRYFWGEVIRLFIVILIGFTIIRSVQW